MAGDLQGLIGQGTVDAVAGKRLERLVREEPRSYITAK
jgi:hypothetical protein